MSRTSLGRESRAAYAASQPLFDALHNATSRIGEQKHHLAKARDTVKRTHVKLAQQEENGEYSTYVAAAVKAWRNATETYRDIFREMAEVTAADPSQGRQAASGHEAFALMAESARKANELAMSFKLPQSALPGPSTGAKRLAGQDENRAKRARVHSVSNDDGDAWASKVHQETISPTALAPAVKPLVARSKRVPPVEEDRAMLHKRPRRAATRTDRPDSLHHHRQPNLEQTPPTLGTGRENHMPGVEYEDLTADVEARLRAKAEKRKAKKEQSKEKKRKRDSADSNAPDFAGMLAGVQKPAKKKPKSETDTAQNTPGKRKVEFPADAIGGGGDATYKKRKQRHF